MMHNNNPLLTHSIQAKVIGEDSNQYPLIAERLAIDVTNALRSAEVGLRSFRSRHLLRRLWDGVTGQGQELQAAIGQDIVIVQKATLNLVREVMREEIRTQYCLNNVLINLHHINQDLDDMSIRISQIESHVDRVYREARKEFYAAIRMESDRLVQEINTLRRNINREEVVRRLTELYRAGELTHSFGEIFGASIFLATIGWQYWNEGDNRFNQEWKTAQAVIKQKVSNSPMPVIDAFLQISEEINLSKLEEALYLTQKDSSFFTQESRSILQVLEEIFKRKHASLSTQNTHISDMMAITNASNTPYNRLPVGLIRFSELINMIANELLPTGKQS